MFKELKRFLLQLIWKLVSEDEKNKFNNCEMNKTGCKDVNWNEEYAHSILTVPTLEKITVNFTMCDEPQATSAEISGQIALLDSNQHDTDCDQSDQLVFHLTS